MASSSAWSGSTTAVVGRAAATAAGAAATAAGAAAGAAGAAGTSTGTGAAASSCATSHSPATMMCWQVSVAEHVQVAWVGPAGVSVTCRAPTARVTASSSSASTRTGRFARSFRARRSIPRLASTIHASSS